MKHEEALALASTATKTPASFEGQWRNELQSTMSLRVNGVSLSGRYKSFVSSTAETVEGPIAGYVNGNVVAFTVTWPTASITAWVGQLVHKDGADVIETLWYLTSQVENPDKPSELWHSVNCGADEFHRVD